MRMNSLIVGFDQFTVDLLLSFPPKKTKQTKGATRKQVQSHQNFDLVYICVRYRYTYHI